MHGSILNLIDWTLNFCFSNIELRSAYLWHHYFSFFHHANLFLHFWDYLRCLIRYSFTNWSNCYSNVAMHTVSRAVAAPGLDGTFVPGRTNVEQEKGGLIYGLRRNNLRSKIHNSTHSAHTYWILSTVTICKSFCCEKNEVINSTTLRWVGYYWTYWRTVKKFKYLFISKTCILIWVVMTCIFVM